MQNKKTIPRKRGERNWNQDNPMDEVMAPLLERRPKGRAETLRVTALEDGCLYEVTSSYGNRWEIEVSLDGRLEVVYPDDISPQNKTRVLKVVRQQLKTDR